MKRRERIYEKKEPKTKSETISFRSSKEFKKWISQQSKICDTTLTEFIHRSIKNTEIKVNPEGKQILNCIQEIRNTLALYPPNVNTEKINTVLGETIVNLRKYISPKT
jgi:hypothetical protein